MMVVKAREDRMMLFMKGELGFEFWKVTAAAPAATAAPAIRYLLNI